MCDGKRVAVGCCCAKLSQRMFARPRFCHPASRGMCVESPTLGHACCAALCKQPVFCQTGMVFVYRLLGNNPRMALMAVWAPHGRDSVSATARLPCVCRDFAPHRESNIKHFKAHADALGCGIEACRSVEIPVNPLQLSTRSAEMCWTLHSQRCVGVTSALSAAGNALPCQLSHLPLCPTNCSDWVK